MKKTLITLLALAGVTMGATYDDFTKYDVASTVTTTGFDYSTNEVTVAVTLNVDVIKGYFCDQESTWVPAPTEQNPNAGSWTLISHMLVNVTGNNAIGVGTLIKSDTQEYFSAAWNGTIDYTPTGIDTNMDRADIWEDAVTASLVMSADRTTGTRVVFTMGYDDGSTWQTVGTAGSVKSGSWEPSGLSLDTTAVTSVAMYNDYISADDAKTIGLSLVPEPTTATLSLLALVGLAARRRRK